MCDDLDVSEAGREEVVEDLAGVPLWLWSRGNGGWRLVEGAVAEHGEQELNPYLYAAGDPANNIDPAGLRWLDWFEWLDSDYFNHVFGTASGCFAGLGAGNASGLAEIGAIFGPIGLAATEGGSCAVGGALGFFGLSLNYAS
ncbi:hypothetical protein ACIRL3_25975 [Streptomyces sp. NPDC102384]|uniref:hypothetical protein n=1 Tax=Streptomyces sp. NPDC102384 TaxID=3366166 RepID=UPI003825C178